MKLLIAFCIASLAYIAAQATSIDLEYHYIAQALPEGDAQDVSTDYDFRHQFLERVYSVFQTDEISKHDAGRPITIKSSVNCTADLEASQAQLASIKANIDLFFSRTPITLPSSLKDTLSGTISLIQETLSAGLPSPGISQADIFVVTALATLFSSFTAFPIIGKAIAPLAGLLLDLQRSIAKTISCFASNSYKIQIDTGSCDALTGLYRSLIEECSEMISVVPKSISPDVERLVTDLLAALDVVNKSSIYKSNVDILYTSSAFSGTLVDLYRRDLLRSTDDESLKQFAFNYLGAVVGVSSALEACLRIISN
ncbi:hypothetical protein FBU30_002349 [Linnemannia zychae]|nr:hypothetical protein FBU30_002349 [Linnemannia zychae]